MASSILLNIPCERRGRLRAVSGRWSRQLAGPFSAFARPAEKGRVLDVGCGTGGLALELAESGARDGLAGIDIAAPYIAFARSRLGGWHRFRGRRCLPPSLPRRQFRRRLGAAFAEFCPGCSTGRARNAAGVRTGPVWSQRQYGIFAAGSSSSDLSGTPRPGSIRAPGRRAIGCSQFRLPYPMGCRCYGRIAGLAAVERGSITMRIKYANFADYWEPLLGGQGPVGAYVESLPPERRLADRGAHPRRLSLWRARRSALADRDCMGGARYRPLTLPISSVRGAA